MTTNLAMSLLMIANQNSGFFCNSSSFHRHCILKSDQLWKGIFSSSLLQASNYFLISIISSVGLVTNGLLVFLYFHYSNLRTFDHLYLLNLAIVDLVCMPVYLASDIISKLMLESIMLHRFRSIDWLISWRSFATTCTVYSIVASSLLQYWAFRYWRYSQRVMIIVGLCSVWVLGFVTKYGFTLTWIQDMVQHYVIPVIIVGLCHTRMGRNRAIKRVRIYFYKLSRTNLLLMCNFFTAYVVFHLMRASASKDADLIGGLALFLNSCINPIILLRLNNDFYKYSVRYKGVTMVLWTIVCVFIIIILYEREFNIVSQWARSVNITNVVQV